MPAPTTTSVWGSEQWAAYVLDHLATESVLLASGARRIDVEGKQAHVPRLNTDGTASSTAENAEIMSSAPDADEILLSPRKLANVLTVSNESIEDSSVDNLNRIGDAMTRSVATALDTAVFDAVVASAIRPAGLRSAAYTLPGVTGSTADLAGIDAILTGIGAIRTAGGRANSVYMAAEDITALTLLKEGTGSDRKLLNPEGAIGDEPVYRIGGATLYAVPGMPAWTALIAAADQIVIGVRKDAEVAFSSDAKFTADGVAVRVTGRFDWEPNDTDGLYLIT